MTIIHRVAKHLHAEDVITYDPDHQRDVRWHVTRPPVLVGGGTYALAHWTDETGGWGVAYYPALTELRVEPAGGAA
jgi:hypothetical protein